MISPKLLTCVCLAMCHCTHVFAEEPAARLHLDISAWLRRQPKDDDSWKGRREFPYEAEISNASADPKLLQFVTNLRRFTKFESVAWPGVGGDYLERLVIENTTLTADQALQLEPIATEHLTISNCVINDEVAKSLGKIRVSGSLTIKQLRMSDEAWTSLGRIECSAVTLKQLQMSNLALSGLLASEKLTKLEAEEIRGCSAEGWRGLSDKGNFELRLADCDFDDQALIHLSKSRCRILHVKNGQVTGLTLGTLKALRECLRSLSLSGCPINDEGVPSIGELSKLTTLDLSSTLVTDKGLQSLRELSELRNFYLTGTGVTDEGFRNFEVPLCLESIHVASTKVTQAWGLEMSRRYQDNESDPLRVYFQNDSRWSPKGGYCERGEFHLFN